MLQEEQELLKAARIGIVWKVKEPEKVKGRYPNELVDSFNLKPTKS